MTRTNSMMTNILMTNMMTNMMTMTRTKSMMTNILMILRLLMLIAAAALQACRSSYWLQWFHLLAFDC